jgi:hypothetical protein
MISAKPVATILRYDNSIRLNVIHRGAFILRNTNINMDIKQLGPTNRYFRFGECLELMSQNIPFRFELDVHAASVLYTVYSRRSEFNEAQFKALYELFLRYIPEPQLLRLDAYLPESFQTIANFLAIMDSIANKTAISKQIKGIDDVEFFGKRSNDIIVQMAEEMQRNVRTKHDTPYTKLDRNKSLIESARGSKQIPTKDDYTLEEGVLPQDVTAIVNTIGKGLAKIGGLEHTNLNASEIDGLGPKIRPEVRRMRPENTPPEIMSLPEEEPSPEDIISGMAILRL